MTMKTALSSVPGKKSCNDDAVRIGNDANKATTATAKAWPSRPQPPTPRPKPRMSDNATAVIWFKRGIVYLAKHLEISSNSSTHRAYANACSMLSHITAFKMHECLQQRVRHACQGRIKGRKPLRPHYQKGLLSLPSSSLPSLSSPPLPSLSSRPLKSS